jgi:hypothetical protein
MISTTSVNHNITTFPREHGEKGNWNYEFTRHLSLSLLGTQDSKVCSQRALMERSVEGTDVETTAISPTAMEMVARARDTEIRSE